jgi:hypothetical protein
MMWGYCHDLDPAAIHQAWDARAIHEGAAGFALLPDRQYLLHPDRDTKALSGQWSKWCADLTDWVKQTDTHSAEVYQKDEGTFHLRASPQASYGYLYITIWQDRNTPKGEERTP